MSWFYLALLAPLFFSVVNLVDDTLVRKVYRGPYFTSMLAGLFGALPLISKFFLDAEPIATPLAILAIIAGALTPLYYYCYFRGLETESPSIVIAILGLSPATLVVLAHFLLHEQLTGLQILGFIIVLISSLGLAVTEVKKLRFSKALYPVLIAVVLLDIISLLTKHVYDHASFYPAFLYYSLGMGLCGLYFLLIMLFSESQGALSKIFGSFKKLVWLFLLGEAFNLAAEFTGNLAVSRGPVSLVKVIEGVQPIYVLLLALLFYPILPAYLREGAEGQLFKKFSLMVISIIGLALISFAN